MSRFLPKHPYENIVMVLDDIKSFLKFIRYYSGKLNELLIENIMMVKVEMELRCGEKRKDEEHWSISILKEKAEQVLLQCDKACDFAMNILRMRLIPVLEHTQTLINMLNPKV